MILKKRSEFLHVQRAGQRRVGRLIGIWWCESGLSSTRLGITAPRQFGNSPERNRFKRLVREAFRSIYSELPTGFDCNVFPRPWAKRAPLAAIRSELLSLCQVPHESQNPSR